jgi:hypothetical protein
LLLGLDHGIEATGDASLEAGPPEGDASLAQDADNPADDAGNPDDGGMPPVPPAGDGSVLQADSGCTPDPSWCDSHCGGGPDNCGVPRQCPTVCASGYACGDAGACACHPQADWCANRCGMVADNCGNPIDCGVCDGGGCDAEPNAEACGDRQCGQTLNNCHQKLNCGLLGLALCSNVLDVCLADGGCCAPNSSAACGNRCNTNAVDNCGDTVQCPTSCGSGLVCDSQHVCCTPANPCGTSCGVAKTDNCGQTVQCACASPEECVSATSTCCTPQGCGGNCLDSCGLPSTSCCMEAGAPEAGVPDSGVVDAGMPPTEAGAPDSGAPPTDASDDAPQADASSGAAPDASATDAAPGTGDE